MAVWYADSLAIDVKKPFFKHRKLENDLAMKKSIETTMRMLSFLGSGSMIMVWYIMLLFCGTYPQAWKVFIVFQLTVVNGWDVLVRRRAIRLGMHEGDINELKSVIPFVMIGLALCAAFNPARV